MTRAEFANRLARFWIAAAGMKEGETLIGFTERDKCGDPDTDAAAAMIADIATNGFDPEPNSVVVVDKGSRLDIYWPPRQQEQAQESAKRSRPFVGSHKLPFDSDYD